VAEPDLSHAVADLDAAPPAEPADLSAHPSPPPEPPRRRSTVRERAPTAPASEAAQPTSTEAASPAPQPVITEVDEGNSAERPRRSGWWSRRFAGG
jgi:ribonuclease E